ncbi:MAG: S1C family serine protease [Bacilli bacterium]
MKKYVIFLIFIFMMFFVFGCSSQAVNEIYNKSYDVNINLDEFEDLIVVAIEKSSPAVIGVSNYQRSFGSLQLKIASTGSGVIYECRAKMQDDTYVDDCSTTKDRDDVLQYEYYAITNRHVIENFDSLKVFIGEERIKLDAALLGSDDKIDLAVIAFNHYKYIQPLTFADSDLIKKGSFAIAIGNPSGYDYYGSATFGIISFPKRYLSDDTDGDNIGDWEQEYIQHDVAINPGNSGGALIDIEGNLIGINTLKIVSEDIDNMGFAIPSNVVFEVVKALEKGELPFRRTLGITILDVYVILNPEDYPDSNNLKNYQIPSGITSGLYVENVATNRPASGYLQAGDIILTVDGQDIIYTYDFRKKLNSIPIGQTLNLEVFRANQTITVNIPV